MNGLFKSVTVRLSDRLSECVTDMARSREASASKILNPSIERAGKLG